MIWKTFADDSSPAGSQSDCAAWPVWPCSSADGFGLPLIGSLFGYQPADEPELEVLMAQDVRPE